MSKAPPKTAKPRTARKSVKRASTALSICPTNGAGWCPYPFSASQLKKRLKRLQEESEAQKQLVESVR